MVKRVIDGAFAALCMALFLVPALSFCIQRSNIELPSWFTSEDAHYLEGSSVQPDASALFSLFGFKDGTWQSAVADQVKEYVPCRAEAVLGNAALQRAAIMVSNDLFGWAAYPTFYGSDYAFIPADRILVGIPDPDSPENEAKLEGFADLYSDFAARHSAIPVSFYCIPKDDYLHNSPLSALLSNPYDYGVVQRYFLDELKGIQVIDAEIPYSQFKEDYYSTDHHWNMRGAYNAYRRIVSALGWEGAPVELGEQIIYPTPEFKGSLNRIGLFDRDFIDHVLDFEFALPDYDIKLGESHGDMELLVHIDEYERGEWDPHEYMNRYAEYFHSDRGHVTIANPEKREGSILIVAYSYSNCVERLFANHFAKTYVYDPRASEDALDEYLEIHPDIDEILFFVSPANLDTDRAFRMLQP